MRRTLLVAVALMLTTVACSGGQEAVPQPVPDSAVTTAATTAPPITVAEATTSTVGPFGQAFSEARRLLDEGAFAEAVVAADRALAINPDDAAALELLGNALVGTVPNGLTTTRHEVGVWPEGIGVTADSVWVANSGSRSMARLNRSDLSTIALSSVGRLPVDIEVTPDGTVWVITRTDQTLWRIDPATGVATAEVTLPDYAAGLTHDPAGTLFMVLWDNGSSIDFTVASYDPATGRFERSAPFGMQDGGSIEYVDGTLWVTSTRAGLLAVDPTDFSLDRGYFGDGGVLEIASSGSSVFVLVRSDASPSERTVYRLSPTDLAPLALATVAAPASGSQPLVTTDRFVIVVSGDASVSFIVSEVPGFSATVPTGLPPSDWVGSAVIDGGRLLFTPYSDEGNGSIAVADLDWLVTG